ncbi:dehydrogenase/reductase SDR family member 7 [Octopus sinensis]|uniref:Dehydrogenase/reductase SDR family member 7 n=1 Tax=Octopus sinensis TaxID=2607531 RepID=A0A6P7SZ31_9MOLL|nr:dehydrogenase/reductase SDR family member 7 [Octopus sinensis]
MVFLTLLVTFICIFYGVQLIRLLASDCDLVLQWKLKFGNTMAALSGQVVWITGASSGVGEQLALEFAAAGCKLVLSARRPDELERVKHQCIESGRLSPDDILIVPLDLLDFGSHPHAVMNVLQYYSQIDILVNNAGRSQRAAWEETSLDVDRYCMELNVLGTLSLTKNVLPHMINRGEGHIVVMGAVEGKIGAPFSASYTGAKHALQGYFDSLRLEMHNHNIGVSIICPGPTFSNLLENAFTGTIATNYGMKMDPNDRRMDTARCARLIILAVANKLDEVWIARHPLLLVMYLCQYCPSFGQWILCHFGKKMLLTAKSGARV